jgi:hypothetical protein
MHADIQLRMAQGGLGKILKPGARHHDGAATYDGAALAQLKEGRIGARTHPEIVNMEDRDAMFPVRQSIAA